MYVHIYLCVCVYVASKTLRIAYMYVSWPKKKTDINSQSMKNRFEQKKKSIRKEKQDKKCAYTYKIDCSTGCKSEHSTNTNTTQSSKPTTTITQHKHTNTRARTHTHVHICTVACASIAPTKYKSSNIDYRYLAIKCCSKVFEMVFLYVCFSIWHTHTHMHTDNENTHTYTHCVLPSPVSLFFLSRSLLCGLAAAVLCFN